MKPRRLHSATILSMVTTSVGIAASYVQLGGAVGTPILGADADLRVPLRERATTFEVMQKMTDEPVTQCAECGAPVQRVFHPVAVHFKGIGLLQHRLRHRGSASASSSARPRTAPTRPSPKAKDSASSSSSRRLRPRSEKKSDSRRRTRSPVEVRSNKVAARKPRHVGRFSRVGDHEAGTAVGQRHAARRLEDRASSACRRARSPTTSPSSVGPPMSVWIAFGASRRSQGRRMNAGGRQHARLHRADDLLLAVLAREVVLATGCTGCGGSGRARAPACRRCGRRRGRRRRVKPPFLKPPLMRDTTQPPCTSMPPIASTSCREVGEVDLERRG